MLHFKFAFGTRFYFTYEHLATGLFVDAPGNLIYLMDFAIVSFKNLTR